MKSLVLDQHCDDALLHDYLLGNLQDAQSNAVDAHVAQCNACNERLFQVNEEVAELLLSVPAVLPDPPALQRLLDATHTQSRFDALVHRVASMLDLGLDAAQQLLARIDDALAWSPGPIDGTELFHLQTGPGVVGAIAGFVRVRSGQTFPHHKHLGMEHVLILQGAVVGPTDERCAVGTEIQMAAESKHSVLALPGADLIYLVVLQEGLEMFGERMLAADPRI